VGTLRFCRHQLSARQPRCLHIVEEISVSFGIFLCSCFWECWWKWYCYQNSIEQKVNNSFMFKLLNSWCFFFPDLIFFFLPSLSISLWAWGELTNTRNRLKLNRRKYFFVQQDLQLQKASLQCAGLPKVYVSLVTVGQSKDLYGASPCLQLTKKHHQLSLFLPACAGKKKRSMHSLIACMWTFPLKISPEEILAWFAVYPGHLRSCKDFHYIQKPELNHFCIIRSWKQDIWRKKEKYLEAADTHKPSTVARKNKKISDTLN